MRTPVTIGVAGLGHWGTNLARIFHELPGAELRWLCDVSAETRLRLRGRYPTAATAVFDDLLDDESLDAVVLATPAATHYDLASLALEADKHVLVKQPLALRSCHAHELLLRAEGGARQLAAVDRIQCHPSVRQMRRSIEDGTLGDIFYLHGDRHGSEQEHGSGSLIWTLGAEHVALVLHLLGDEPVEVNAHGESYLQPGAEDVLFLSLSFATGISAHLHLSRLDAESLCSLTVVGSQSVAAFDDLEAERKLTIYDRADRGIGIVRPPFEDPVSRACERFIAGVRSPVPQLAELREAVTLVNVLEALERSLQRAEPVETTGNENEPGASVIPLRPSRREAATTPGL